MPNVATVLKAEITRLARKEVAAEIKPLRKANAQYRREIAQLKRDRDALAKRVAALERRESKRTATARPEAMTATSKRFSANGLRAHRERTGLSAADYAVLVGVSAQTIYNWEHGRSKPRAQQLSALVAVRGLGKREAERRLGSA